MSMRLAKGYKFNWNKNGGQCPACNAYDKPKGGILILKQGTTKFLGCSRYPECKYTTGSFTFKKKGRKFKKKKYKKPDDTKLKREWGNLNNQFYRAIE